jgi:hypothetical protein
VDLDGTCAVLGEAVLGSDEAEHIRVLLDSDIRAGAAALTPKLSRVLGSRNLTAPKRPPEAEGTAVSPAGRTSSQDASFSPLVDQCSVFTRARKNSGEEKRKRKKDVGLDGSSPALTGTRVENLEEQKQVKAVCWNQIHHATM